MSLPDVFAKAVPTAVFAGARSSLRPAHWLLDALTDPRRRDRSVIWVLVSYAAAWTLYAVIAKASQNVHYDVAQLVAWSREPGFGYNHPPLAVWIVTLWFSIFPLADWAAYLLASINVAVTLWICWRLFGDWLDPVKRVVALASLTLVPLCTFHALVYNANSAMMPFWAAATFFFLRAYNSRAAADAALAGLFVGAAMMTKYWSIFLVAGLVFAVLIDSRRWQFLRSPAPWIASAVAFAVFAPHLVWLATGRTTTVDFAQWMLDHATSQHLAKSLAYVASAAGYVGGPILMLTLLRPGRAAMRDLLAPREPDRRLIAALFWIPLLLPAVANLAVPFRLTAVWTMPDWSLLAIVLLASPLVIVTRKAASRILAVAMAVPFAVLVASPSVAMLIYKHTADDPTHCNMMLARKIDAAWRLITRQPMRLIGGQDELVPTLSFYLADRPVPLQHLQPALISAGDRGRSIDEGAALVCFPYDRRCLSEIKPYDRPGARWSEVELSRSFLGMHGTTLRYTVLIVPPHN